MGEAIEQGTQNQTASYATMRQRTFAFLIDVIILILLDQVIDLAPSQIAMALNLVVGLAYPAFESSKLQATPGKVVFGLVVTDIDGTRPSYARALARAWSINLSCLPLFYGILLMNRDPRRQTLHDKIANCVVVPKSSRSSA
jgi:uncharacterized RDD family membrane protein YckC